MDPANAQRMEQEICREQLLAHIYNRLGIMKGSSQARFETNNHVPCRKMHEKSSLFLNDFSGLSTGSLKEPCEFIDRSLIVVCMPYTPGFRAGEEEEKHIHCSTAVGSCAANTDEVEEHKTKIACEDNAWKDQVALELERRRQAEEKNQLTIAIQEAQRDNRKLERYIQEWKVIAEQAIRSTSKHRQRVEKIRTVLEELKSVIEIEESCYDQ